MGKTKSYKGNFKNYVLKCLLMSSNSAKSTCHLLPNKLSWRFGGCFCRGYLWQNELNIVLGMQFPAEIPLKFPLEIQIPRRTSRFVHLWVKITPQTSSSLSKVLLWLSQSCSASPLTSHTSLLATNDQQFPKNQTLQLLCWLEKLVTSM